MSELMRFGITKNDGQFHFWHTDCEKGYIAPMHNPKKLASGIKQFKCAACEKVGQVNMLKIVTGIGELEVVN